MGNIDVVILLFLLPNTVSTRVTISDAVTTDTSFYYGRFQTFPSKLATVEYLVMFNMTKINRHCDADGCKVTCVLDIYTTEYDKNLKTNCSKDVFCQLRNGNLYPPLDLRDKPYRFTTCKMEKKNSDILHCDGKTTIQGYIPRNYGFSFGYKCDISAKSSLAGLSYNLTISGQSNRTQCLLLPRHIPEKNGEVQGLL